MQFLGRLKFLYIMLVISVSCASIEKVGSKIENTLPKDKDKLEIDRQTKESDIISYGKNNEVTLYTTNNTRYYILSKSEDIEKMTTRELKLNSIDTSIVKITHTNMAGNDGIMLTYYDIRIFLSKNNNKNSSVIVGIYEPARATWVFSEDIDSSNHSVEIKNGRNILGPVKIELRSMSRLYR